MNRLKKVFIVFAIMLLFVYPCHAANSLNVEVPVEIYYEGNASEGSVTVTAKNNEPLPTPSTITVPSTGTDIVFTVDDVGNYFYQVKQVKGTDISVNYDETIWNVDVYVYWNGNQMVSTVNVYPEGSTTKPDKIVFRNIEATKVKLTYVCLPDPRYGMPSNVVVPPETEHYPGEEVTIAANLATSQNYAMVNGQRVSGRWIFIPWDTTGSFNINTDTVVTGGWQFIAGPKTGDETNLNAYVAMLFVSLAMMYIVARKYKENLFEKT